MNIIVSYCEEWKTPLETSKHHLLRGLALEGHRILYLEAPISIFSFFKSPSGFIKKIRMKDFFKPMEVEENIWTLSFITFIPFHKGLGPVFDSIFMNKIQQLVFFPFIKSALKKLDFINFYMITYLPLIEPLVRRLKPIRNLFHIVDEWSALSGAPKTISKLILKNFSSSDIAVVTSQPLYDKYEIHAKEIKLLRHGTHTKLFNRVHTLEVDTSKELKEFKGKKVGYYGALHKINFVLVAEVAAEMKDYDFIFIGPKSGPQGLNLLPLLPQNCVIWDAWKRDKLPSFLSGIDVFWMPFFNNELCNFMSPIKVFEVMSSGVPIVSTDLHETKLAGGNLNFYAKDKKEHVNFLEKAITSNSYEEAQKRVEYTTEYDWSERHKSFSRYLFNK